MRIAYIAAGAGGMICGNCLRDNALAAALIAQRHEVSLIPTYTPLRTDEVNVSTRQVFYGGVNLYLKQKYAFLRRVPRVLNGWLDHPGLLRWASRFAVKTQPAELGELTVAMLQGAEGPQKDDLERLVHALEALRPEIVHITNSMLSSMAPAIKQRLGVPVCCSLQGEDYFLLHLPEPYRGQALGLLRRMASSVDAYIAPSRDHAHGMAPHLGVEPARIHVILPGINLDGFPSPGGPPNPGGNPKNSSEFVIGYLARVAPEKGLHLLAEAAVRLEESCREPGRKVRLRAAGWLGPEHRAYLGEVTRLLEGQGFGGRFEYLGEVTREEKIEFLRSLDVLSVPVSYSAPKGLYVLEAFASGVPVVQPRVGVFPELIEATGGGLLVEPDNAEDLARGLREILQDPSGAARMGERGQKRVHEHFHSRRMAEETAAVYRGLLNQETTA